MRNVLLAFLVCLLSQTAFAQCAASFTYTTSGLTATFTNTSAPSTIAPPKYIVKTINYGTGSGTVYFNGTVSKTYTTPGTYQVIAYVDVMDSLTQTLVCSDYDTQYVTVSLPPCSVSISKSQSGNTVTFTANNLSSTPGMTYSWNFGDGNTGSGSPVTHTYATSGYYHVTLVASSSTASCSKTDSTFVTVQQSKIDGYVIGDSLSMDTFKVWLIKYDSSTQILSAVDSLICSNNFTGFAAFSFANPAVGTYRLKAAQLDGPTSGTGKVPTYHTSSLYWNTATVFNHNGGTTTNKYIIMQNGTVTSGPGFVGGNVTMGANKGTAAGDGIEGIAIFLKDAQDNLVKFVYTDVNGAYSFGSLPVGTYSVYPEDMGFATTPAGINITANQPTVNAINFEKSESNKTIAPKATGINDVAKANAIFSVSPNPASGKVFITWADATNGNADVVIADVTGRKVYQTTVNTGSKTELNLSQLQSGQYFISVKTNNATATQQVLIQK